MPKKKIPDAAEEVTEKVMEKIEETESKEALEAAKKPAKPTIDLSDWNPKSSIGKKVKSGEIKEAGATRFFCFFFQVVKPLLASGDDEVCTTWYTKSMLVIFGADKLQSWFYFP